MKKKIEILLLIVISIVGSRLIFGQDYHLNSDNLKEENLYVYNNLDSNKIIATYVDEEEFYYVSVIKEDSKSNQYKVVKFNLTSAKQENEYIFNNNEKLDHVSLFKQNGYIYLIANNSDYYYKFDSRLTVYSRTSFRNNDTDLYGIYKDKIVYVINNDIYYEDKIYGNVPVSCGKTKDIIYDRDTYLHFYNEKTGFGCLYDLVNKKVEYLDYENVDIVKDKLLEYQSNRLSFKYDGNTYYFNDITESDNIRMHDSGDYLFTIDASNSRLKIYNIESRKIIFEKGVPELKGSIISNIIIDDYVLFTMEKNNKTILYVWDYSKETRHGTDMINYDEKEYKFKNNELKEEIKNDYNVDVYIYDQAVDYFDNYYVIPSYDDILINSRLSSLKIILDNYDINKLKNINGIKVFFDKNIVYSNGDNKESIISVYKGNYNIIAINITDDNFKDNFINEMSKLYPNLIINEDLGD